MARQRMIHPSFHKDEDLARLAPFLRLTFIALWGIADRRGRLEDRPMRIKLEALPYDDVDMDSILTDLASGSHPFIFRYVVDGRAYIQIRNFNKFQNPHVKEAESEIPPCASLPFSTGPAPGQHPASRAESESESESVTKTKSEKPVLLDFHKDAGAVVALYNVTFGSKIGETNANLHASSRSLREGGHSLPDYARVFEAIRDGTTDAARWCRDKNHAFDYVIRPSYRKGDDRVLGPLEKILNELSAAPKGKPKGVIGSPTDPPTSEQVMERYKQMATGAR